MTFSTTGLFVNDVAAQAQKGKITGKIVAAETHEPLIGANVVLPGKMMGAATDLEGNFRIYAGPPAKYIIVVTMIGYTKITISDVTVQAGKATGVNAALKSEVIETEGVTVTAKAISNTEAALLKHRQKSNAVSDAVSAEEISRTGGGNAAEAMKQVTGASVVEGKYVYVRGLGDRYTSTQLNGADIPSSNPYKRAASIDLIPSNLVENIVVLKSFTPDKPGDFAGGIVNIKTRDFPENIAVSFSASSSYNSQATFNNGFLTYNGSSTDWLGMDNGKRQLPSELKSKNVELPDDLIAARKNADLASKLDRYTKLLNSQIVPTTGKAPPNQNYSFSIGNQINLFNRPFGFLASLTYNQSNHFYDNGKYMRWRLVGSDSTKSGLDNEFNFNDMKSTNDVLWGGLLKLSYELTPYHKISFSSVYNQNGESTARILEGSYPYDIDPEWIFKSSALQYKQRSLKSFSMEGEHKFNNFYDIRVNWRSSLSKSIQDEPDLGYFTNYITDSGVYGIKSNLAPERYFRNMDENRNDFQLNISLPFKQWAGKSSLFKFGGLYATSSRKFSERIFKYQPVSGIGKLFRDLNGDIDALFSNEYLGIVDTTFAPNGNQYYDFGITISEIDQKSNNYHGDQTISAFYTMIDLSLIKHLRFIGGARFETTALKVVSEDTTKQPGNLNTKDILPSLNVLYALKQNTNLRLAYTRTLARPSLREISPFVSFDFKGGTTYLGNPDLKRTLIDNLDLRWEWFSRPGEIYALSLFSKNFHNPIETVIIDENYNVQWKNVDNAKVFGIELELRKRLDVISQKLGNFLLGGNLSFIHSRVDIDAVELKQKRMTMPETAATREFQGQSPYILNINITYDNQKSDIASTIYYNIFGPRLAAVSLGGTPDVFEQPAALLNYSFSIKFTDHLKLKFSAKNILNSKKRKIHTYKGKDYLFSKFNTGRLLSFGITYEL